MRSIRSYVFGSLAVIMSFASGALAPRFAAAQAEDVKPANPAMALLGRLVGGTWQTEGTFRAELRYEWRIPGKAIRGVGAAAIGTPQEFAMESLYGWDPAARKAYYFDFHGHDTVYRGWAEADGNTFRGDFECTVGESGHYRFEGTFRDDDTLLSTLFARNKEGAYVKLHTLTFKRRR